jgi:phosphatidylglycerol:prolipoprotein diacylglycerol transferase
MTINGYWVNNLNPVLIQITDKIAIRYYGVSYLLSFAIGMWLLNLYYKNGKSPLDSEQQTDAVLLLITGTIIGGRLGNSILYDWNYFISDPLSVFRIWEGGMASHGGMIGVAIATWWIAKKFNISFLRLGDIFCTLTPPGLFLVRIANFINGELWGKITHVSWAVIFPLSSPAGTPLSLIPPRHPSQLYEAFFEGFLLLLYTQYRFWKSDILRKPGHLSGEFFIFYATARIFCEFFRELDSSKILGISRGTFYSLFLVAAGILLIKISNKNSTKKR